MDRRSFILSGAVCFLLLVAVSGKVFVSEDDNLYYKQLMVSQASKGLAASPQNGCDCMSKDYDCGCCVHMEIDQIDLNDTGCVNVTYLPDQYGISLTFSLDGNVLINQTVSLRNPPPICFGVPYLHDVLSLCIAFYNLDVKDQTLYGCIKLEATVYHVLEEDWDLGCFKIGPHSNRQMASDGYDEAAQRRWLEQLMAEQEKRRMMLKQP